MFCVFNTPARNAGWRSGTEILEVWDSQILGGYERSPRITVTLYYISEQTPTEFRNFDSRPPINRPRAPIENSKWPPQKHKPRAIKVSWSLIHILNGCQGSLCRTWRFVLLVYIHFTTFWKLYIVNVRHLETRLRKLISSSRLPVQTSWRVTATKATTSSNCYWH